MKILPEKYNEIISIEEGENIDDRKFKKIETRSYLSGQTDKGIVKIKSNKLEVFYIWEEVFHKLPLLNIGDIIVSDIIQPKDFFKYELFLTK